MHQTRRQIFQHMVMLATVAACSPMETVHAASPSGSSNIVDLGIYRRGRTGPLPGIVKTPADLVAARLVLPYSRSESRRPGTYPVYVYKAGEYESLGLQKAMGATGERQEIGLVTDAQADWLMGGSPKNMLAQAEAHGSVPVHYTLDGRVVDVFKFPKATSDYRGPERGWKPYFDISASPVQPDTAHYPSLSYIAYLATGDLYYLAELQFAATAAITTTTPAVVSGAMLPLQQRQWAWGLRDIIGAYIATPEGDVPEPLLPKSHWKKMLDANIAFLTKQYINGTQPLVQEMGFLACDDMRYLSVWQQDYLSMVLGWAVWTGKVPQVRPVYDFQIRQAVKRATGPLRSQAIQYDFQAGAGNTWAETLAKNGRAATANGHVADIGAPHYIGFLRGALKVAVMNGVAGAQEAFAYADAEAKRSNYIPLRWAV